MTIKDEIIRDILKGKSKQELRDAIKTLQHNVSKITGAERLGLIAISKNLLKLEGKEESKFMEDIIETLYAFATINIVEELLNAK